MNGRQVLTVLGRGEVLVPVATVTIVLLLVHALLWWGPASQARAEARAEAEVQAWKRAVATARAWRTDGWTITAADVPDGAPIPVQDDWLATAVTGGDLHDVPVPFRVPGLQHLMADAAAPKGVEDAVHGVRSGPVDVFSHTAVLEAPGTADPARGPAGLTASVLERLDRMEGLTGTDGPARRSVRDLVDPVLTTTCPRPDDGCVVLVGRAHEVTLSGVEAVPTWIEPRHVTVAATWVDRVLVVVATVSPVGAEVPDVLDARHLADVLADKVRADPPAPPAEALEQADVGRTGGAGRTDLR